MQGSHVYVVLFCATLLSFLTPSYPVTQNMPGATDVESANSFGPQSSFRCGENGDVNCLLQKSKLDHKGDTGVQLPVGLMTRKSHVSWMVNGDNFRDSIPDSGRRVFGAGDEKEHKTDAINIHDVAQDTRDNKPTQDTVRRESTFSRKPRTIRHSDFVNYEYDDDDETFYEYDDENNEEMDTYYQDEIASQEKTIAMSGFQKIVSSLARNEVDHVKSKPTTTTSSSRDIQAYGPISLYKAKIATAKVTQNNKETKSSHTEETSSRDEKSEAIGVKEDKDETEHDAQVENLLSKLNTLIHDIQEAEGVPSRTPRPLGDDIGECAMLHHSPVIPGFKGYVNYMEERVSSSLPYMVEGEETFLLHHLDNSMKGQNDKVSVELTSKSCHCVNGLRVQPVQIDGHRHAMLTNFTAQYFSRGWQYIHTLDGQIKTFVVTTKLPQDAIVSFHHRVYAMALRIFPQDWKRLPWVRIHAIECG